MQPHRPAPNGLQVSGCRVQGSGLRVQGAGLQVSGFGYRVLDFGCWVSGLGLRILGFGSGVPGTGYRDTSITRKRPRPLGLSQGRRHRFSVGSYGRAFLMSEVPLYQVSSIGNQISGFGYRVSGTVGAGSARAHQAIHEHVLPAASRVACGGLCYRLGGDNLSELSANHQPPSDKTGTDNSPQGSLRVYPRTLL